MVSNNAYVGNLVYNEVLASLFSILLALNPSYPVSSSAVHSLHVNFHSPAVNVEAGYINVHYLDVNISI